MMNVCVCVCMCVCVCVCVCVCLRVNHSHVTLLGVKVDQKVFLACTTTSTGRVVSHSKDPVVPELLLRHLQDIPKASDWGLALRGSISGKLDLEMCRASEDTDGGKDDQQIIDEQAVRHLFGSWFVSSHEKPFGVGKLVQHVRV